MVAESIYLPGIEIIRDADGGRGAYWMSFRGESRMVRLWTLGETTLGETEATIAATMSRALRARGYRLGCVIVERGIGGLHASAGSYEIAPNTYGADLGSEAYHELDYLGKTYWTSHGPDRCPAWARATA